MSTLLRKLSFLLMLTFVILTACESQTPIVNNISEREANEILVLLASHGIPSQKIAAPTAAVGGGTGHQTWDIVVPSNSITESLAILNKAGLPRVKGTNLLDLFGTQGLVPSDLQDKIRYQEGLSEQLANTIRKIDGIIDADVQVSFPKDDNPTNQAITASVYIKHQGVLDNPNSLLMTKIKRLIASSVPGLSIDNVTVLADRALYSDVNLPGQAMMSLREEPNYVSIWGILVAKQSVGQFQLIFYLFLILIFLLVAALAWMIWKFFPILHERGPRWLIDMHQVSLPAEPVVEETENESDNIET